MLYAPYMLAGLLAATGLFLLIREHLPSQPELQESVARLAPTNLQLLTVTDTDSAPPPGAVERIGRRIDQVMRRIPGFSVTEDDLAILAAQRGQFQEPPQNLWAKKATYALAGLLAPLPLMVVLQVTGLTGLVALPAGLGLLLAVLAWAVPDSQIRSQAEEARAEFLRAAIAYLRLIAIQRLAGALPKTAMTGAADVSTSWPFRLIRQELYRADWAHIPAADAITELGRRIGVPQLTDVGDIMRLAGDGSTGVSNTLLARAKSLREKLLTEAHATANAATTNMAIPRTLLLVVFILALFYPLSLALVG